jgi:hypothetical protein
MLNWRSYFDLLFAAALRADAKLLSCRIVATNWAKARAFALACLPLGNTVQRSKSGKDQSDSTCLTLPC